MGVRFAAGVRPAAVFHRLGLRTRGPRLVPYRARDLESLTLAVRFRDALEEVGGLYATFGRFLAWRADLLRADYLIPLRSIKVRIPPPPRAEVVATLCAQLGLRGERVAATLGEEPLWSTLGRCAWRGVYEGRAIVVQLERAPAPAAEFRRFSRGVRALREPGVAAALTPQAIAQFEAWVRLDEPAGRERNYLDTLASFPQKTLVEYPRPVADLCSAGILCWELVDGEPMSALLARGDREAVAKIAEAVLEQACLLSVVDAEFDLDALVLTSGGRVALRRASRLVSIPAAMARSVLKYISSVLSSNSPFANHQLVRMAFGHSSTQMESRLFDALSNLEPELKINLRFPQSVGAFESNWRALARIQPERPLFLDSLHRNLIAVGYLDAESARTGESPDAVAEAQWPVVGRLLRTRLGEATSGDIGQQWVMGSGLLLLEGVRQAVRLADGFRDNDVNFNYSPAVSEAASRRDNRTTRTAVILAILLMIFLVCLRWGPKAPAPWSGVIAAGAVVSGAGLLWLLSRMG